MTVSGSDDRPLVLHARSICDFGGGPEKTILNSPRLLDTLGYDSVCAYMHAAHELAPLAERAGEAKAPLVSVLDRGFWDWRVVTQLVKICRERNVAIWHGHEYKSNVLGLIVRRFWPMKLVSTVHGWVMAPRRMKIYYPMDRFALRRYDEVVCVSDDLHQTCLAMGVPEAKCHLIENAIDSDEFQRRISREEAKGKMNAPPDTVLLGAMGRLAEEKGFDLLIRAADELIRSGQNVALWIAGEGPARKQLETLIDDLGQGDRIRLLGHVTNTKDFYQAIDMYVLSSLREGLPNVLLEAMAMEVPIVATRVAGVPILLGDGREGLLVESTSVDELVSGIRRLLGDEGLCTRLAEAARQKILASYSFEHRMRKMCRIYDQVLSRNEKDTSQTLCQDTCKT